MSKHKSLFGYGGTNKAIAKLGKTLNIVWDIYDDSFKQKSKDEWGNNLLPSIEFNENNSSLEIVTPGIPPHNELVKKAKNIQSDYDFFYDAMPKSIWISGTNGKSTTTKMIGALLNAPTGANIGTPIASMDFSSEFFVLETSSFSLHYTKKAYPMVYVLLPISDDHLSWHGGYDEYKNAKLSPLLRMQNPCIAIIPSEFINEEVVKNAKCKIIFYENSFDLASKFEINTQKINFDEPFLLDSVLALAVEKIIKNTLNYDKINSITLAPHTLEEHIIDEVLWVDDSKGTNEQSTISAYKRYKDKRILGILGGDLKGVDAKKLIKELSTYNARFYLIGTSKDIMESICKELKCDYIRCDNLKHAVELMKNEPKECVRLLSPACASLDEFANYKQRGELFIKYAKEG